MTTAGTTHPDRTVLLVAHTGRADVVQIADKICAQLAEAGIALVARGEEAEELDLPRADSADDADRLGSTESTGSRESTGSPGNPGGADSAPHASGAELVLTLGGDGTLLRGAEMARAAGAPVLGINLGRVGFLTETDADHIDAAIDAIIRRDYTITERMTVDVTVNHQGSTIADGWALNEISIEKATRERILDVVIEVDGRGMSAFGCDGVLCATPTGSTAYAFSAGGPILWPDVDALLVVPSNAHALFARPIVVSAASTVSVNLDPEGHGAVMACDGRRSELIPPGARLRMRAGAQPVRFARLHEETFTERIVRKFGLPVNGWRDRRH